MKKKLKSERMSNSFLRRELRLVFITGCIYMSNWASAQLSYVELSTPIIDVYNSSSQFADLDQDGDQDLLVTGLNASGIAVTKLYINDGLGGFTEKTGQPFIDVHGGPESIAVGDVNNDTYLDVFISGSSNSSSKESTLYLNDGSGNFTISTSSSFSTGLDVSVVFGDFTNDGSLDLLLAGWSGGSGFSDIYENDGAGVFTLVNSLLGGFFPTTDTADINNDGNLDVVMNSFQTGSLDETQIYLGNGDGTFVYPVQNYFNAFAGTVRFADINGDDNLDLFVMGGLNSSGTTDSAAIYINDGSGGLILDMFQDLEGMRYGDAEFADIDTDGDLDIIMLGGDVVPTTQIYENDGTGHFDLFLGFDPADLHNGSVRSADINGDNLPEIFMSGQDESDIAYSILYKACYIDSVEVNESACTGYDFNGKTRTKSGIYSATFTNQAGCDSLVTLNLTILRNELHESIYTTNSSFEFDGNTLTSTGYYDASFTNQHGCDSIVHLSLTFESNPSTLNSSTWFEPVNSTGSTPYKADFDPLVQGDVRMGDLDGDGDLDIVMNGAVDYGATLFRTAQTKVYLNDGFSNFTEKKDAGLLGRYSGDMELFDVDGDGDLDVLQVGTNPNTSFKTTLDLNDGTGKFTSTPVPDLPPVTESNIGVGDFDGDGDQDIVITGRESAGTYVSQIYFNEGNGAFTADTQSTLTPVRKGDIAVGDLNGDGSPDIIITGTDGLDRTLVYINDGFGVFSEDISSTIEDLNMPVTLLDVDKNNTLDVLIRKKLYLNDGTGTFIEDVTSSLGSYINPKIRLVVDLNQDGIQDLVLLRSNKIQTLLGDGIGGFALSEELPPLDLGGAAIGDLNGDGYPEIVVTGEIENNFRIDSELYVNDGTGKFTRNEVHPLAELSLGDAAFADLDGDGDVDLITCGNAFEPHDIYTSNEETTKLYFNGGTGIFTEDTTHPFYHVSGEVVLADFDGDADVDALITGHEYDRLSSDPIPYSGVTGLYLNDGSGQFTLKSDAGIQANTQFLMAEAADVDNDGDIDLVLNTKLMINDGSGVFTESNNHDMVGVNFGAMSLGDVNGDGYLDLFRVGQSLGPSGDPSILYINDGAGGMYQDASNSFIGTYGGSSNLVDMDGDGDLDLFVTGWNSGGQHEPYAQVYFNDGSGNFSQDHFNRIINVAESNSKFSDLDGDGDQDLIVSGLQDSDRVAYTKIYLNNSLGNFREYEVANLANMRRAALEVADVDSNGSPDIFISGFRSDTESRLYSNVLCQNGNFVDEIIELEVEACEVYYFFGAELTTSGQYQHIEGVHCGTSITTNLDLTILEPTSSDEDIEACVSYDWNGVTYSVSGTYQELLVNSAGCDSTATLNLTILEPTSSNEDVEICESYEWNGVTYTSSGTYQEMFTNAAGCDSTATLNLTILESHNINETLDHCGDFQFGSQLLAESGTYTETFQNQAGCDSTVTLTFGYLPLPTAEIEVNGVILFAEEVAGATYQWYDCDTDEPISGGNKRQLTPPRTGEYYVEVSNGGCSERSDCILFDWVLATQETLKAEARIYPSQTEGSFTLSLNQTISEVNVKILSLDGRLVHDQAFEHFSAQKLHFRGESGLYLVQVSAGGNVILTQRIIKH